MPTAVACAADICACQLYCTSVHLSLCTAVLLQTKEELRAHLMDLERGSFLKPTDAEGVWEFNMVERDIVYEVIPHYQRRRLHAKLAQVGGGRGAGNGGVQGAVPTCACCCCVLQPGPR